MKDERLGGSAWIVATGMMIVTMALHPTGHDLVEPGRFEAMAARNMVVHGLAIASLPLAFLGALALARRAVEPLRLGLAALVVYGFALVAAMLAASANGFVAPPLIRELIEHPDSAVPEALLDYSHHFNHAFTHLYVVGSSAAILLWSIALLRTGLGRALGVYGLVVGVALPIGLIAGHLRMDVHGFGLVVLAQAVWTIAAGVSLVRER